MPSSPNALEHKSDASDSIDPPEELAGLRWKVWISEEESGSDYAGAYKFQRYRIHSRNVCGQQSTDLWRRYSDFHGLRELLLELFPGLYVPPLPPKRFLQLPLSNWSHEEFLKERYADLNRFLTRCVEIPPLRESHAFQVFLIDHEQGFKNALKSKTLEHCDRTDSAILERLQRNFGHSVGRVELPEDPSSRISQLLQTFEVSRDALLAARVALDRVYTFGAAFASEFKDFIAQVDELRQAELSYCRKYAPDLEQRINITPQLSSLREWTAYAAAFLQPLSAVFRREWQESLAYCQLGVALDQMHQVCDRQRRKIGQLSQKQQTPKVAAQLDAAKRAYEDSHQILKWRQRFLLSEEEHARVWVARVQRYANCIARIVKSQLRSSQEQLKIGWSVAFDAQNPSNQIPQSSSPGQEDDLEEEEKSPSGERDDVEEIQVQLNSESEDGDDFRYL